MRKVLFLIYKKVVEVFYFRYGIGRNFYPIIRSCHDFIISLLKPDFVEIQGHKIFLDTKDTLGLSFKGVYESFETELVKKEIRKGDTVLDIGANIGYYTLIFAKLVGEDGKVFAFEPDPTNFSLLKKNVEINSYKNIELIQKAVSNKTGKIKLYLSEYNTWHKIYDSHDSHKSIEIESLRLDDYFKNYNGKIDFIKMDIEGAEGEAISGMINLLKKNNNVKIVTEFNPKLNRFGIDSEEYLKLLIELGFKLYEINESEKKIEQVTIFKLLEIYTTKKGNYTNLLCIREREK